MSDRIRNPSSRPGPLNEWRDVRFALSYEALKITGTSARLAISRIASAVSIAWAALSITQGPTMKASGLPPPTVIVPIETGFTTLF